MLLGDAVERPPAHQESVRPHPDNPAAGEEGCQRTDGFLVLNNAATRPTTDSSSKVQTITSLSDDVDKEKLGDVPAAMVGVLRKTIDIQKKALEKFEESYENYDK